MSNLQKTLERLAKMNQQYPKKGAGKFYKPKPGKNNLLILSTPQTGDPFLEWGGHKNLLDIAYQDIACNKHNKGEDCLICQVIDDLQKQNWKGNFPIWKPIELKIRYFSPVVDLDDLEAGVQWWGYGKSVLTQFETWLLNLEEGEEAFYSETEPVKVIVTYNKEAEPANMYKLDKKSIKPFPTEQIATWKSGIKPLIEIMGVGKSQEEVSTALESYMTKIQEELEATAAEPTAETGTSETNNTTDAALASTPTVKKVNKLDALKTPTK